MSLRYASFEYHYSGNLGDQIQSLAAEQFLPRVDRKINRDAMRTLSLPEPHLVIMNAWFSHFPERCFPPADSVLPVFFGLHIGHLPKPLVSKHFLSGPVLDYFRRYAPIGCRDRLSRDLLRAQGIEAFYSKCLSLSFPRREQAPTNGLTLLVDVDYIPQERFGEATTRVTHAAGDYYDDPLKAAMARRLLALYRYHAGLVVTSRLHCALPCIAMGIPVVFFGDSEDYRLSILSDLGLPIHSPALSAAELDNIDWNPAPLDISAEQTLMRARIEAMVRERRAEFEAEV